MANSSLYLSEYAGDTILVDGQCYSYFGESDVPPGGDVETTEVSGCEDPACVGPCTPCNPSTAPASLTLKYTVSACPSFTPPPGDPNLGDHSQVLTPISEEECSYSPDTTGRAYVEYNEWTVGSNTYYWLAGPIDYGDGVGENGAWVTKACDGLGDYTYVDSGTGLPIDPETDSCINSGNDYYVTDVSVTL